MKENRHFHLIKAHFCGHVSIMKETKEDLSENIDDLELEQSFAKKKCHGDDVNEITGERVKKAVKNPTPFPLKITDLGNDCADVKLPLLVPLNERDIPEISFRSFLTALIEEDGIKDPNIIHKKSYEAMNALKEKGALDKYVLNDDEAAVICAIHMLLNQHFSLQKMFESCEDKAPSKLMVMMLIALRKLPRYRQLMYFENKTKKAKIKERNENTYIQVSFCVASKEMNPKKENMNTGLYREIFKIEKGWGYDISDFTITRDESNFYGKVALITSKTKDLFMIFFFRRRYYH